ncbi:MAG: AtpZ/AtpI family protein [Myxococcales bacterium]|nr:AtpZ/AtpI family protein [Myxococcales bacterium]
MPGPKGGKEFKTYARLLSLGIELAVSTVIGLYGGKWLDKKFGTAPTLTLIGLLLGLAAGFKSLYQTARRQQQNESLDDDQKQR